MGFDSIDEAIVQLEKTNAELQPELLGAVEARDLLARYARAEKLVSYGKTALAARLDDAAEVARASGVSIGKAKATVDTGKALKGADEVRDAFKGGDISSDQATEIARAEQASPGSSSELLAAANSEAFHVLRDKARRIVLEAEQNRGLSERQSEARSARSHTDELGMININLAFEPHVGTPILNRAETLAAHLQRTAKKEGRLEPFERFLADAYAAMLSGAPATRSRRPELVVLVSYGVAKRGWKDVEDTEVCTIPGVGPVSPEVAKKIAQDAFLTGVFYDGKDLRHMRRWTRHTPVEVRLALELGDPPDFDGIKCLDCGNRFGTENDHLQPHYAQGPASTDNLKPRCYSCHKAKTERDRKAGKLGPRAADEERGPPRQ
ncbi:MAG: HNH endonuclease [Actinomycetota bacterium]